MFCAITVAFLDKLAVIFTSNTFVISMVDELSMLLALTVLQQFMKINPLWPAASGPGPIFGAKPCNLNVMSSTELHGNIAGGPLQSMQDKGQGVGIFLGHTAGKDNKISQATAIPDPAQRKQQVLLQQAWPLVTPNNILHGPAFIFPFNQQQAVAASASVQPGYSKLTTSTHLGMVKGLEHREIALVPHVTEMSARLVSTEPELASTKSELAQIKDGMAELHPMLKSIASAQLLPNFSSVTERAGALMRHETS